MLITLLIIPAVLPVTIVVGVAVRVTSQGPALYWSKRVGANNRLFAMPKFRTMHVGTPAVATHLPSNARATLTPIGGFLRSSSLDEIPQLWSVFKGDMSLVGPRPALFNQHDLILLRDASGVSGLTLGITGWAQVNGRDELGIPAKVSVEVEYLRLQGVFMDIRILFLTAIRVIRRQSVQH
ncbi:MAG: sugar transferase [Cytophagaceae bacterium]|nr:MAG: sugar transferase [Cytophagaceae bacterium]